MAMFRVVRFACIIALTLIKFRGVELTSGVAGLKNHRGGPEGRGGGSPGTRGATEGRTHYETAVTEDVSKTSFDPELESIRVDMINRWLEGINPWTDAPDCCIGFQNRDCNDNCTMEETQQCNLECGYLLLPSKPPAKELTVQLNVQAGEKINLTVSVSDLRPGDSIAVFNKQGDSEREVITCDSFTREQPTKYFVSDAETFFVNYKYSPSAQGEGCGGLEKPTGTLIFNTIKKVECNIPISEDADGKLYGDIVSPGFPALPYPSLRDCTWTIEAPSPGYGIELQVEVVDLDGTSGDYIQVNDGSAVSKTKGYIMTWSNTKPKYVFKIYSGGSATIYFHSGLHMSPNKFSGFHIIYKHFGNESLPGSTTTLGPALPTPSQGIDANYTLYIAGKTPEEFNNDREYFKDSLVVIANAFCQEEHIDLKDPISFQDVIIHSILYCPPTWPNSQSCAEVIIQIVARTISGEYELTNPNLKKMWEKYGWDRNVTHTGIAPYVRNEQVFTWWLVGALSVLTLFIIILLAACYCLAKPHKSSSKNKAKSTLAEENTTEKNKHEFPKRPFSTRDEYDEDDDMDSYISDQQDSYIDYEGL